jgi:EPS-associated MarR family transcriptional regulator
MPLSSRDFQVLDALDSKEITTQRQLAQFTGISLGQVNYLLHRLMEKGLIKIGNFKKNSRKIGYAYLLTPKGVEARSKIAIQFVLRKLEEYNHLKNRLASRLAMVQDAGNRKIVFVGPKPVREFVESVLIDQLFDLELVGWALHPSELNSSLSKPFDVALLFHEKPAGIEKASAESGLPAEKLLPLW